MNKRAVLMSIITGALTSCAKDKQAQSATAEPAKPKTTLTALSSSKGSNPSGQSSRLRPAEELEQDPEVAARKAELQRLADQAREQAAERREEEQAERLARVSEQLGTRLQEMDANGDGFLAQDEVSGPLARRFEDNDTNGDGYLDATEQAAIFERLSERMSTASGGLRRNGRRDRARGGGGEGRGFGRRGR